jgi:hypothetical protein
MIPDPPEGYSVEFRQACVDYAGKIFAPSDWTEDEAEVDRMMRHWARGSYVTIKQYRFVSEPTAVKYEKLSEDSGKVEEYQAPPRPRIH